MKEILIDAGTEGQRLDKFLRRYLPEAGTGFIYRMLRKKNIVLNDQRATGRELLAASDIVKLYFSDETLQKLMGEQKQVSLPALDPSWILYEDADMIAVNKPAGILSQRSRPEDLSLVEYLRGYLTDVDPHLYQVGVSNRLDRNTSGIVLAGKHLAAAQLLSELIRTRAVRKYYLALVKGIIRDPVKLNGYLERDQASNISTVYQTKPEGLDVQKIETELKPAAWPGDLGFPATLLQVELITGKTHQIRAHLSAVGHPIAGDRKYGDPYVNRMLQKNQGLKRQYLHAWKIVFPEQVSKFPDLAGMELTAPLPQDLVRTVRIEK